MEVLLCGVPWAVLMAANRSIMVPPCDCQILGFVATCNTAKVAAIATGFSDFEPEVEATGQRLYQCIRVFGIHGLETELHRFYTIGEALYCKNYDMLYSFERSYWSTRRQTETDMSQHSIQAARYLAMGTR